MTGEKIQETMEGQKIKPEDDIGWMAEVMMVLMSFTVT
jgi:hypothetical protein